MQINFRPETHVMMMEACEMGSTSRPKLIASIVNHHFTNIKKKKIVARLDDALWGKLLALSGELDINREQVIEFALNELHQDYFPIAEEVEGDIPCS
jgi:Glu-tRNA(Gln) amidotransferase subunit E-like FAD-binding protein